MNDQGIFFRYFFPLYALLLYIIMCAWDELQKLDFLHPEMYRGRTFAYYRDISYRRARWFYERHMGRVIHSKNSISALSQVGTSVDHSHPG